MSAPRVSFVSLGCPKALVDSERIITRLRAEGYEIARKHDGADLVVVNTCGFLDSARDESLAAIGDAMKENGKVIVTGCMGATPELIREKHPNVLAITGPQAVLERMVDVLEVPRLGCHVEVGFCAIFGMELPIRLAVEKKEFLTSKGDTPGTGSLASWPRAPWRTSSGAGVAPPP